jgi:ParB family chromosome partitioning protein
LAEVLDLPVELIEPNPFLTRYSGSQQIDDLAQSIETQGQLEPIAVRMHPQNSDRYQVIYGHRRLAAIKKLKQKTIRAEVKSVDDAGMLEMSVVENLQRQDISDFEKGMLFRNLSENFRMTYDDIGRMIGKSKQLVSNHIAMTKLFSEAELESDPSLIYCLQEITEAHARILAQVQDKHERIKLLKITVKEHLCAREIKALVGRPREREEREQEEGIDWISENVRNNHDNSSRANFKQSKVCVIRADSLNFLISKLKITPYEAGAQIAKGAAQVLLNRGIDPLLPDNRTKILIEKSKYAGWGKMSTTTDSKLIVHEPTLNSEFLRGYLETLLGIKLELKKSSAKVQIFDLWSDRYEVRLSHAIPQ